MKSVAAACTAEIQKCKSNKADQEKQFAEDLKKEIQLSLCLYNFLENDYELSVASLELRPVVIINVNQNITVKDRDCSIYRILYNREVLGSFHVLVGVRLLSIQRRRYHKKH